MNKNNSSYSRKNLKNIAISHSISKFNKDETILTLEDQPILNEKGEINEIEDVLHNVTLRENEITEINKRRRKKLCDFEQTYEEMDDILPNYNDINKKVNSIKTRIQESGNLNEDNQKKILSNMRGKLKSGESILNDLNSELFLFNNYYNDKEMKMLFGTQNTKINLKKRKKTNKNSLRCKDLSINSRSKRDNINLNKKNSKNRIEFDDKAIKSSLKTIKQKEKKDRNLISGIHNKILNKIIDDEYDVSDSQDMQSIIFDSRKKNVQSLHNKIKERNKRLVKKEQEGIIFNDTIDFLGYGEKETEVINKKSKVHKENNDNFKNDLNDKRDFKENKSKENLFSSLILEKEPLVSSGVASALKMFKRRGLIDTKSEYDFIGRNNDEKSSWIKNISKHDPAPEIRIEYLDPSTGKPLTRKQAFRLMSHKFHGVKPGKIKTEKIQKNIKNLIKRQPKISTETPTGMIEKFKNITQKIENPYVVLDGSKNAALINLNDDKFNKLNELDVRKKKRKERNKVKKFKK